MIRHTLAKLAFVATATTAGVVLVAGAAFADPHYFTSNGQFADQQSVGCDMATHRIGVSPTAGTMPGYDGGQYVGYQVSVRDVTTSNSGPTTTFAWQGSFWIKSKRVIDADLTINQPVSLGSGFTINGVPGHLYKVVVAYQWWIPSQRVWTAADYNLSTSYLQGYTVNGIHFTTTTGLCHT